jgi:dynein heavy chain 2
LLGDFDPWTVLGNLDIEQHIEENFKKVEDWENNFKMLKIKRKELDKIQDYYKIDCFNISSVPFKCAVEDLMQRLADALTFSLKSTIKRDSDLVDDFIKIGMEKLNAKPASVEEIGKAKMEALEIANRKHEIVELYKNCEEKNKMLRQIAGQGANLGAMQDRWENFDVALNRFSDMIEEQRDVLRNEIDSRIKEVNNELEKFYSRWIALKPKEMNDMDKEQAFECSEKMKEWRVEWDNLEKKVSNVTNDCHHFGMPVPAFKHIDELKVDLVEQEQAWRFFDEFQTELEVLSKEDWLSFRGKGLFTF